MKMQIRLAQNGINLFIVAVKGFKFLWRFDIRHSVLDIVVRATSGRQTEFLTESEVHDQMI